MPTSAEFPKWEKFEDRDITDTMLEKAAKLFSENYGIWGSLAEQNFGAFAKKGKRIRMGVNMLKSQLLPPSTRNIYVRVIIDGQLAGNVFASRWVYDGGDFCWVSQLVVSSACRNQGLATELLRHLREGASDRGFGILSSHPAAISAALRAFGCGLENANLEMTKTHAHDILRSAPISYVKNAELRGSLFQKGLQDGTVSSAFTNFWVDHQEPDDALAAIGERGVIWPFGDLLEGHEYLVVVNAESIAP